MQSKLEKISTRNTSRRGFHSSFRKSEWLASTYVPATTRKRIPVFFSMSEMLLLVVTGTLVMDQRKIAIRTVDTKVVVIALSFLHQLGIDELWIEVVYMSTKFSAGYHKMHNFSFVYFTIMNTKKSYIYKT